MTPQLRQTIQELSYQEWHEWTVEPDGFVREWAEVAFVPMRRSERRDSHPFRYLAIRLRPPQGRFFSDGTDVKLFAVVTNDWQTPGRELLPALAVQGTGSGAEPARWNTPTACSRMRWQQECTPAPSSAPTRPGCGFRR